MKICLVHNAYGRLSGEEVAVAGLRDSLTSHGHTVIPFFRSSTELDGRHLGKIGALFTGVYNIAARREFARLLDAERPDLVHINNLFPLISPSILDETKRRCIPTVMTVHNYRLLCPTGLLFSHGEVCHRCLDGGEWWCAIRNCTGEWPKSAGYAVRNWVARMRGSFIEGIDRFVAPTEFVKSTLVSHAYSAERIDVVRYMVRLETGESHLTDGEYVGYVGRISPEKGVDTIVEAARRCPDVAFRFAGHYLRMPNLPGQAPPNCEFVGEIPAAEVNGFLAAARFTVFSSRWYEISPLSVIEAMLQKKPVICSRVGGLPEFVDDGVTGLLCTPGDQEDLSEKIRYLWQRPELCRSMGEAARKKILAMFSPEGTYLRLLDVYKAATERRHGS
jgi:glycosyltransferase involved in cell wall biosynthesis